MTQAACNHHRQADLANRLGVRTLGGFLPACGGILTFEITRYKEEQVMSTTTPDKKVEPGCNADGTAPCAQRELTSYVINCDQVAWLMDIFNRYLPKSQHPRVSQERDMRMYGMLYEVMEIANLKFADDVARLNGTPSQARPYIERHFSAISGNTK